MERTIHTMRQSTKFQDGWWSFFVVIGVFILLYNPPIFTFNSMHAVGMLSLLYLLIHIGAAADMLRSLKFGGLLLGVLFWFGYLLYSVVLMNSEDWIFTIVPLYFLIDIIPFGMAVRIILAKKGRSADDFINIVIAAALIQAFLALAAFFNPEIRSFFLAEYLENAEGVVTIANHRFYGLAAGLSFDMPILQTVIALAVIYPSRKLKAFHYFAAFLLFFSAIINARNAIVVVVIGLFSMVILDRRPLNRRIRYGMVLMSLVALATVALPPAIEAIAPSTFNWIVRGFKEILGFFFKGDTKSAGNYFAYITDPSKYQIPEDLPEILFGAGHPTMGMESRYGFASDIGYINDLWRGGIVYIVLLYLFFAAIMLFLRRHPCSRVSFLGTFMLILYPFINIKGIATSTNAISHFLFLLYVASADGHNRVHKNTIPTQIAGESR